MNCCKNIFKSVLFAITLTLNSCGWYKCEAEGKISFRKIKRFTTERDNYIDELSPISMAANFKCINSLIIINLLTNRLNQNRKENYLSNDELAKDLNAEIIGGTDVVSLSYKNSNAKFATEVVNTWIDVISTDYAKTLCLSNHVVETFPKNEIIIIQNADGSCSKQFGF